MRKHCPYINIPRIEHYSNYRHKVVVFTGHYAKRAVPGVSITSIK